VCIKNYIDSISNSENNCQIVTRIIIKIINACSIELHRFIEMKNQVQTNDNNDGVKTRVKKNAGFTLIELIVTVSVAAILMSIAVPSYKNMIESNRLSTGTNELVSALILARSEALKRSQNTTVCVSTDSKTCSNEKDFAQGWIVFLDCNSDGMFDANGVDCDGDGVTNDADQVIKARGKVSGLSIIKKNKTSWEGYNFAGRSRGVGTFDIALKSGSTVGSTKKQIVVGRSGRIRTVNIP